MTAGTATVAGMVRTAALVTGAKAVRAGEDLVAIPFDRFSQINRNRTTCRRAGAARALREHS
jgi:hypothetical protein